MRGAAPEGAERNDPAEPARSPEQSVPRGAAPIPAACRVPAAGPGSMRRAALWLWLCALALRLQPALPVSAARARAGSGGKPVLADPPMPPAARGGGGEAGTFLPALARRAGDRDRETGASASIASAVGGRRAGSAAKSRGLGRPAERSLRRWPALNYATPLHMRRSPPACGGAGVAGSPPLRPRPEKMQ